LLIFICISLLINGCFVNKTITEKNTGTGLSDDEIVTSVAKKNISDSGFYIKKAVVDYSDATNNLKFLLSVKHNRNGEYLAIARAMAGLELFRIYITSDTILINDRLNQTLSVGNGRYLKENFSLDFNSLVYLFGDFYYTENLKSYSSGCLMGTKQFTDYIGNEKVDIKIDCNDGKVVYTKLIDELRNHSVSLTFFNFIKNGNMTYPEKTDMIFSENKIGLNIDIQSIDLDWNGEIDFVSGSDYKLELLK
jgi:hypothetical protein